MTQPKGAVIFKILVTAIFTVVGGLILGSVIACAIGLICSSGGGGGGTPVTLAPDQCISAPNACGQSNVGTLQPDGSCNATPPDDSSCPAATIGANGFYAEPATVGLSGQTTLTWDSSNSDGCTIRGDNGYSYSGAPSGSVDVAGLTQTTTFTLTCSAGIGGTSASKSIRVVVDPHYKEL